MKGTKTLLTIAIILLVAVLGAILIVPMIKKAQPISVKILAEPSVSSLPVYFAKEQGIFEGNDVKLKASVERFEDPQKALDALAAGQADFAVVPWPEALRWMKEKKDTLLCFFSVEFKAGSPQEGLFTRKDLKFEKVADLAGKSIGITQCTRTAMQAVITSTEVDPTKVTLKVYPTDKLLDAVRNGEVDMVLPLEPYYTVAEASIGAPFAEGAMFPKWINSPYPASGVFITPKYLREKPEAVKRMNRALNLTYLEMPKNSDSARAILAEVFGIKDSTLQERFNLPDYMRLQDIEITVIQELADKLEIYGVLPGGLNVLDMKVLVPKEDLRD